MDPNTRLWFGLASRRTLPLLVPFLGFGTILRNGHRHAPASPAETWAFAPATDTFSPNALLDLRSLNERVAGEHGFIQRTPDGDFADATGKPIRFWAVDEYVQDKDDDAMLAHKARWLAKRGVNMVRVHTQLAPEGDDLTAVNEKAVQRIWRLVAAMKKEGIYTTISPYWGVSVSARPAWKLPGRPTEKLPAMLFFDPTLQTGYRAWLKALYDRPVPELGGKTLSQEPAVALIQLQNEDSLLFWTVDQMKGDTLRELRARYGAWLVKKYGSLNAAAQAWGDEQPPPDAFTDKQGDEFADGRAGLYIVWFLTGDGAKQVPPGSYRDKRLSDQLAFYTETMREFNASTGKYLRNDLHCPQLVNAGNWRPADPKQLFDAERYSYAANDVMGVNRYFTGQHDGKDNGWAIRPGDGFTNNSVLLDPRGMPTSVKQPVGFPFVVPETEWVAPSAYQSEGPLLTAAYQSLTGVDVSYFFADGDVDEWQPPFANLPWNPPTGKWSIATPMQAGMFPAAALLFRKGYVRKGAPVVHEERAKEDLWGRKSPLIAEEGGWDPNRDAGNLPARSAVKTGVDPLAFLAGPVEVVYDGDPSRSRVSPHLAACLDTAHQRVVSETGEVRLNYGIGLCTINAPRVQAVTGFLHRGSNSVALSDVTLHSSADYASVTVVSLDDKPLREASKIFVQIGTVARPTDWEDKVTTPSPDNPTREKRTVVSTGKNPWAIRRFDGTLEITNSRLTKAVVLDANFLPVRTQTPAKTGAGKVFVILPPDALYLVLE